MPLKDYTADQLLLVQQLKRKLYLGRITLVGFIEQLLMIGIWPERITLEVHEVLAPAVADTQARLRGRGDEETADAAERRSA